MQKLLFVLFLIILQIHLHAQNTIEFVNDTLGNEFYLEPVSDTIPNIDIFEDDAPLNITLTYDITSFIKNKSKGEYQDAILQIHYNSTDSITKNIQIKARGNFRKDNCFFPPIHLNFKSDPLENSGLTGKIKLVTHCSNSTKYDSYILKEYLAYKLYNVLSGFSFKVRLLNILYIDTGKKNKNYQRVGFLIEPLAFLSKRHESIVLNPTIIREDNVIAEDADRVALFQYMIGNTDWRIKAGHNTKYIKPLSLITNKVIPVPYDFDFSGFVGTSYSFPQSWASIETVKEREYLGYCRDSNEEYLKNINRFIEKEEEILTTISSCKLISEREKNNLLKYIESFYKSLNKTDRFIFTLKNECRTDF
ncbi:MAG: hypothetical protein HQ541_00380 [Mariniphaga sp.]|nr:hypothetical protein [Mariniphaga sp.]